jgi:hypothetical protein
MASNATVSNQHIDYLSQLLLSTERSQELPASEFEACLSLAHKNHVVVRWLQLLPQTALGQDPKIAELAHTALTEELARISHALPFLESICNEFQAQGSDITVIKSLDHWPDLGSDLDLYSNAQPKDVIRIMRERFKAEVAERSWGDRLAGKWNFNIPELPESVEIHVGRLGQTGEHVAWADGIPRRAVEVQRAQYKFRVASPEDRLMISTLQRMYRHFYFRLCDIVDSAQLVESGIVDFTRLKSYSESPGIWKGVATYLVLVSDYVKRFRGTEVPLPSSVRAEATFGGEKLTFGRDFLRVPILPESVSLYATELTTLARHGDVKETFRLSLLPYLAVAAAIGQKLTGSDKGIW